MAEWLHGRLTEAECAFAASVTGWRDAGHLTLTAWGWYELVCSGAPRAAWTRPR